MNKDSRSFIDVICQEMPVARAQIRGSRAYYDLEGTALFYQVPGGVLLYIEACGLPTDNDKWGSKILGFHIHEGTRCAGNAEDPFADTGGHYNPTNQPHPKHAGDLPPLFGSNGYSWSVFATNRFTIKEIIGRTIIIHSGPDDFTTQPSGNAGDKIACGEIVLCD